MSEYRKRLLFPQPLSGCVDKLTRPVIRKHAGSTAHILTNWRGIVGDELAAKCHPVKIDKDTITLTAQHGFATELHYMSPVILSRIADFLGNQSVKKIIISSAVLPSIQPIKPKKNKPSTAIETGACETIEDEELKKSLLSFASTLRGD